MVKKRIYLDTAAATPLDARVEQAMRETEQKHFANPSSIHTEGVAALKVLEEARKSVAESLGAHGNEIVFTSGGTESNNLALQGIVSKGDHVVVSAIEHKSVLATCEALEKRGVKVTYLPVSAEGVVDLEALKKSLRPETVVVSIMYGNNEIGTIQPLDEIKKIIRHYRKKQASSYPYFHTDACQATRFFDLKVDKLGVDLLTINGAKIYGPKGVGVLYVRRGVALNPLIYGGGQEQGRRSGTEHVAAAVGLAAALTICAKERTKELKRLTNLRQYFIKNLLRLIKDARVNGSETSILPHIINITFAAVLAEQLVLELDAHGVACGAGSACSSQTRDESYVILALGSDRAAASSSIRFSLGREIKKSDLVYVIEALVPIVAKCRSIIMS